MARGQAQSFTTLLDGLGRYLDAILLGDRLPRSAVITRTTLRAWCVACCSPASGSANPTIWIAYLAPSVLELLEYVHGCTNANFHERCCHSLNFQRPAELHILVQPGDTPLKPTHVIITALATFWPALASVSGAAFATIPVAVLPAISGAIPAAVPAAVVPAALASGWWQCRHADHWRPPSCADCSRISG